MSNDKILYIDPINTTYYYNFCFVDAMIKINPNFEFITGEFLYDLQLKSPKNTKYKFFKISNAISKRFNLSRKYRRIIRGIEYPINLIYTLTYILINDIRLIHFNFSLVPHIDRFFFLLLIVLRRKVYLTIHNAVPHDSHKKDLLLYKKLYESVTLIITLTQFVADQVKKEMNVHNKKIVVIPHGNMDFVFNQVKNLKGFRYTKPTLVFLGVISSYKGILFLLNTLELILRKLEVKLIIIGQIKENLSNYYSFIQEKKMEKFVTWKTGYITLEEIYPVIKYTDLFIFPYNEASQSGGIPTAHTLGKPVVIRPVGGLPEMVIDGKDGIIAKSPQEMANKINNILVNVEEYNKMKKFISIERKRLNDWEHICRQFSVLYNEHQF